MLTKAQQEAEYVALVNDLMKVIEMLMPGLHYIAIPDWELLNMAQVRAERFLALHREGGA